MWIKSAEGSLHNLDDFKSIQISKRGEWQEDGSGVGTTKYRDDGRDFSVVAIGKNQDRFGLSNVDIAVELTEEDAEFSLRKIINVMQENSAIIILD